MTAPVHRLRNRLMLAFSVFALAVASLFGLYVAVFVYSVEDRFFEAMLEQEARQQLDQRAASGTWSPPRNAFMTIHDSPATFPADLKVAFNAEPWRREIAGTEGRHYHLRALQPGGSGAPGWLVAEVSQQLVVRPMRRQILALLAWSGVAVVVVAVLAGAWLARRTTRPLSKLAALVDDMAPDRLPVGFAADFPDDEVGVLARGLDRLSGQVRAFVAREHAFTRDASHELRTPLAVIRSATEQLAREPGLSAAGRLQLDHVQQSARHLEQTVITLLTLSREENVERDATPLAVLPVLEQVVVEQAALLEGKPVAVRVDVPGDARLTVPGPVLHMLLANLVGNAFAHTRAGEVHIDVAAGRLAHPQHGAGRRPRHDHAALRERRGQRRLRARPGDRAPAVRPLRHRPAHRRHPARYGRQFQRAIRQRSGLPHAGRGSGGRPASVDRRSARCSAERGRGAWETGTRAVSTVTYRRASRPPLAVRRGHRWMIRHRPTGRCCRSRTAMKIRWSQSSGACCGRSRR